MNRDRNLLFGVFAVQLKKATPSQIMAAAGAWAADQSRDLPSYLADHGSLSNSDLELIQGLVDHAVQAHGGDAAATLRAFGGPPQVDRSFYGSISITKDGAIETVCLDVSTSDSSTLGVEESPGRYSQVGETARGGMGRILLVHDEFLGRDVALKELLPGLLSTRGEVSPAREGMSLLSRFLQEARVTGQLEHPSIVPVYELGHRTDGTIYYTMKLVRGDTLDDAISSAAGLEARLGLLPHFIDLCQGIGYAHSLNVIHRDIKPSNVMVGKFGETVILDWGLAKIKDKEDVHSAEIQETLRMMNLAGENVVGKTKYGEIMGTPLHMPPEQAKGQLDQVDERSDVYSLGVVLYQLLTGTVPFTASPAKRILEQVIGANPTPIRELAPDVPVELAAICEKAMNKDRRGRYPAAKALAEEVQRFQSGALVQAHEYTTRQLARRFVRRHKAVVASAMVAAVALIAVSSYYLAAISQANRDLTNALANEQDQRREAQAARDEAEIARDAEASERKRADQTIERLEASQYISLIRLASNHLARNEVALARARLMATAPQHRDWEWGYLYRALDTSKMLFVGHTQSVNDVKFSPDGTRVLTASADKTAKLWDAATGSCLATYSGHTASVNAVEFSPDGTRVLTGSSDRTARLWDTATGAEVVTLSKHTDAVHTALFSPDGARALTASTDGTARLWNAETGAEIVRFEGHSVRFLSAAFSPDGDHVATASWDGTVRIWETSTGAELAKLEGPAEAIFDVRFNPDGSRVLTSSGFNVMFRDSATGNEITKFEGHGGVIRTVAISPDGSRVLTGAYDNTARLWDAETGEELVAFEGHTDAVGDVAFNSDGSRILTGSQDHTVRLWDTKTGAELIVFNGHMGAVSSVEFGPGDDTVLTGATDGTARLWDSKESSHAVALHGRNEWGTGQSFSPDGKYALTSRENNVATIWDVSSGAEMVSLRGHSGVIVTAVFSPDGNKALTASFDNTAQIWDAVSGAKIASLSGHSDKIYWAVFGPDGTRALTTSMDSTAKIWNVETGTEIATLRGHTQKVHRAYFTSNGSRALTLSSDGPVKIWNMATGTETTSLGRSGEQIYSAVFSPDGESVLTVAGGKATLWNARTGEALFSPTGHTDWVHTAVFNSDGSRMVTASEDRTARIWDTATGREVRRLLGHASTVFSAAFNPDASRILTASVDKTVRVWDAETGEELLAIPAALHVRTQPQFDPSGIRVTFGDSGLNTIVLNAMPWNNDAWRDASERQTFVSENLAHITPTASTVVFGLENRSVQDGLSDLTELGKRLLQEYAIDDEASTQASGILGVQISDANGFPLAEDLALIDGSLIYSVNGVPVRKPEDVASAIQAFVNVHNLDRTVPRSITFEILHGYDRRLVDLRVRATTSQVVTIGRKSAIAFLTLARAVIRSNKAQALEDGSPTTHMDLFITPGLERALALEVNDRIVIVEGIRIRSFEDIEQAVLDARDRIEERESDSFEIVVFRDWSDQYITTRVQIE